MTWSSLTNSHNEHNKSPHLFSTLVNVTKKRVAHIDDSLQTSLFINELNNKMKYKHFQVFEKQCLNVICACKFSFVMNCVWS